MATHFKFLERSGPGMLAQLPREQQEQIARNAEAARKRIEARRRAASCAG